MTQREFYKENEKVGKLFRIYSDKGYKLRQIETGVIYDEAIDVETAQK